MHIGIVELCEKNHHSMILNWIKLANFNKWKITLFTTKEIYNNVKSELNDLNYNVVIKNTNHFFFQIKINKIIKKKSIHTLVYLTICNYLVYLLMSFKSIKFGITVHNANTWFNKNNIRNFKHYIKRFTIQKIKSEASFFIVNSENMKRYIDKNCRQIKPVYVLPFSLRKNLNKTNTHKYKKFTTVYPGSINHERRRYDSFIDLAISNPGDNFIVLGNYKNNNIDISYHNKMKKISNIKLYNHYVDNKIFQKVIKKSHLLFSDIRVKYSSSDIYEVYGVSKDSGISYLMNEFNLPCMLNTEFRNFYELKNGSLYFENYKKMHEIYNKLKKNKKYLYSLVKKIKKDTKNFTIKNYSKKFNKSFF